jgi:hypothetical protein
MAVAVEGESKAFDDSQSTTPTISFDSFNRQSRWIEIFNRGQTPFDFSITPEAEWFKVSASHGTVKSERRIEVTVDWDEVPSGKSQSCIRIAGPGGKVMVNVAARRPEKPTRETLYGFVEADGCVAIEAEHFTKKLDLPAARWDKLDDFGRTLSAMTIFPMNADSASPPDKSPSLQYSMYLFDSGPLEVQAILSPSLEVLPGRKLRYAISFDDQPPQIVSALPEGRNRDNLPRDWETTVKDAVRVSRSKHALDQPGYHTLKFWMVDPGVVLEKLVVNCGSVKPSYLGPPESYRGPVAGAPSKTSTGP